MRWALFSSPSRRPGNTEGNGNRDKGHRAINGGERGWKREDRLCAIFSVQHLVWLQEQKCGRDRLKSTACLLKSSQGCSRKHTGFITSRVLLVLSSPDTHILLPSHLESVPLPHLHALSHLAHPLFSPSHTLWLNVLNPCSPTRFCKETEIWAVAISVFPRLPQGLALWPVDKCFPN